MRSIVNESIRLLMEAYRHSRCVVLIPLSQDLSIVMRELARSVKDDELYTDPEKKDKFGRENEPHVTVLYGIMDPSKIDEVRTIVAQHEPFNITFGKMSVFEADQYDVLKVEVRGKGLEALHHDIKQNVENDSKHPVFHGHATIAYVKKGAGKRFVELPEESQPLFDVVDLVEFVLFKDLDSNPYVLPLKSEDVPSNVVQELFLMSLA